MEAAETLENSCAEHDPCAESSCADLSSAAELDRAAAIFRALGDSGRLRLLEHLARREHCVSELAERFEEGMSTISQRLRTLRAEGLVARRRNGKHVFYRLADDHVEELIRNALEHAREGEPGLGKE